MKTILSKILVLLIFITVSGGISTAQNKTFRLGFTGMYPHYYWYNLTKNVDWDWYSDLKLNTWQGWYIGDYWNTNAPAEVLGELNTYGIDGFFQPDTIIWAGYGRVQVNQVEETGDRFRYNEHGSGTDVQDNSQYGNGQMVRYLEANNQQYPQGMVVWGAEENLFQSFCGYSWDPMYQLPFPFNNYPTQNPIMVKHINNYYVKPRMRISVDDAFLDPPLNVIKIIVKAFDGSTVREVILTTEDFRYNNISTYDGRYLEDYFFRNAVVRGDSLNAFGKPGGRPEFAYGDPAYFDDCQVDYQIYWYGEVTVWIDYVKIMDEAAYRLLNPDPALNLDSKLQERIDSLKRYDQDPCLRLIGREY